MSVLAVDDVHSTGPCQPEQATYRWDRRLGVRNEQAASALDEVVLHVDHDQRGSRRVNADLVLDGVLGDFELHDEASNEVMRARHAGRPLAGRAPMPAVRHFSAG